MPHEVVWAGGMVENTGLGLERGGGGNRPKVVVGKWRS